MSRSRGLRPGFKLAILPILSLGLLLPGAALTSAGGHPRIGPGFPTNPTPPPIATTVFAGSGTRRTIALTFDDGYDPERCVAIADTLTALGVTATWFPNGVFVRRAPDVWRSIAKRFPIGNHTYLHPSLVGLPEAQVRREILRNQRYIERVTGRPMARLLRPPYGATDRKVLRIAASLGYPRIILWDTSDADTATHITPRGAAKAALRGGPGSIVLMHCGPEVTPGILPIVIAHYACQGYRFATVEELLAGVPGRQAKVDCPPPPIPSPEPRGPRRSPEPSTGPDPYASAEPDASPEPAASGAPSPEPSGAPSRPEAGAWTVASAALDPVLTGDVLVPLSPPGWLVAGPSGIVAGIGGCLVGTDLPAGAPVTVGWVAGPTQLGCSPELASQVRAALERVTTIGVVHGELRLADADGVIVLVGTDPAG